MNVAKVIQNPGPVIVRSETPSRPPNLCLTYAYNAMSIAKASNVRKVARPETRDDMSVTVTWLENESNRAMKVTAVATGCTASPRVQEEPIVTDSLFVRVCMVKEYPWP